MEKEGGCEPTGSPSPPLVDSNGRKGLQVFTECGGFKGRPYVNTYGGFAVFSARFPRLHDSDPIGGNYLCGECALCWSVTKSLQSDHEKNEETSPLI